MIHICFNRLFFNDLTDLMPNNNKMFTVFTKDMIKEKFNDVHGVSTFFLRLNAVKAFLREGTDKIAK